MPSRAIHSLPFQAPPWGWLENTKADPMQNIMCRRRRGRSFCRVSFSHSPADGGQRSECAKVLGRRGSSPSREGGWLLSLSLGKVVGGREQRLKGRAKRGASPPPSSRRVGWPVRSRLLVLREAGREEAEGLTLIGGQRRSVAIEVSWDAAAGRTGAVTQSLDASLSL